MTRRIAFPFLCISDLALVESPWLLSLNDGSWQSIGDYLSNWDPSSNIRIRREITIDPLLTSKDLEIETNFLKLQICVRLGTGQGRLARKVFNQEFIHVDLSNPATALEIDILGRQLSSTLDISTDIVLAQATKGMSSLSPARSGERLWQDKYRVRLEGEEPRFPIEVADLAVHLGDTSAASAPWYLHWSPKDWGRDFHGALRLFLNAKNLELVKRVEAGDVATLQTLMADVIGQICERFLQDPDAHDLFESAEPGSLGAQATSWLKRTWPGQDVAFLRTLLENRPGTFRAGLLSFAEIPEE